VATWCDDFGGIMEVLKYPAKLGELSEGAMLQWAAWAPSARLRTVSGVLHGGHANSKRAALLASDELEPETPSDHVLRAIGLLRLEEEADGESVDSWVWIVTGNGLERLTERLALAIQGPISDPHRRYTVAILPRDRAAALDTMEGIRSGGATKETEHTTMLPALLLEFCRNEIDWESCKKTGEGFSVVACCP
jgi:hypothetical protein